MNDQVTIRLSLDDGGVFVTVPRRDDFYVGGPGSTGAYLLDESEVRAILQLWQQAAPTGKARGFEHVGDGGFVLAESGFVHGRPTLFMRPWVCATAYHDFETGESDGEQEAYSTAQIPEELQPEVRR